MHAIFRIDLDTSGQIFGKHRLGSSHGALQILDASAEMRSAPSSLKTANLHCDAGFRPLLADFDAGDLERAETTVFGLWPDFTLAYMNAAWFRFAAANRGEPAISRDWNLGRCVLDAIPAPLRDFYETNYRRCLQERRPWEHTYECSSDDVYRTFHMTVFPLHNSAGLLLINSVRIETPLEPEVSTLNTTHYTNKHGLIMQCCHCRRFRQVERESTWHWVARWIKAIPQNVSHGICATCAGYYYPLHKLDHDHPTTFSTVSD
jgi:hypothetical protein